jgi:secreted Zn-dependent insulinase-like peptidase
VKYELGETVYDDHKSVDNECNNGLLVRFQLYPDNVRNYALALLFDTLIERVARSELRADKELGYVVMSFVRREWNAIYWNILVQTDRRMSLAEAFVADFIACSVPIELEQLTEFTFAPLCAGVVATLRQPYASLHEQSGAHFKQIDQLTFDFDFHLRVANLIESKGVSIADLMSFFKRCIAPKAPKRRVLLCRLFAGKSSTPQSLKAKTELNEAPLEKRDHDVHTTVVESLGEWKRSRPLIGGYHYAKM